MSDDEDDEDINENFEPACPSPVPAERAEPPSVQLGFDPRPLGKKKKEIAQSSGDEPLQQEDGDPEDDDDDDDGPFENTDARGSDELESEASTATPLSLDFTLPKLVFIFEKMGAQPPNAAVLSHAARLIDANRDKISSAPHATVSHFVKTITSAAMLEVAMGSHAIGEDFCRSIISATEAPDYIVSTEVYHRLLEELDLGSHHDYPGLQVVLESFSLIERKPGASVGIAASFSIDDKRLTIMTMTFALLELWPGSMALGTSLFKHLICRRGDGSAADHAVKKHRIYNVVNIVLRVLAGDARSGAIDVKVATRLVGNLLNTSEGITRHALAQEISHLVAYCTKATAPSTKGKGAKITVAVYADTPSSSTRLPGQVGDFLKHLTLLTHERKDRRLDMVGLLAGVLTDHIMAYNSTPKLMNPALHMVLVLPPLEVAIALAREIMEESSNSHVRVAVLGAMVSIVTTMATLDDLFRVQEGFWNLVLKFMNEDPVEKVRLLAVDAIEAAGKVLARRTESATPSVTAVTAAATGTAPAAALGGYGPSTTPSCLQVLPGNVIIALVIKCGDVSTKVQDRASALLFGTNDDPDDVPLGGDLGFSGLTSEAPRFEFRDAFDSFEPKVKLAVAKILLGLDLVATQSPDSFHDGALRRLQKVARAVQLPCPMLPPRQKSNTPGALGTAEQLQPRPALWAADSGGDEEVEVDDCEDQGRTVATYFHARRARHHS